MLDFNHKNFYELGYEDEQFGSLQFIRVDRICQNTYITMKNFLTEEVLTFEKNKIGWIREDKDSPIIVNPTLNKVADKYNDSLY